MSENRDPRSVIQLTFDIRHLRPDIWPLISDFRSLELDQLNQPNKRKKLDKPNKPSERKKLNKRKELETPNELADFIDEIDSINGTDQIDQID